MQRKKASSRINGSGPRPVAESTPSTVSTPPVHVHENGNGNGNAIATPGPPIPLLTLHHHHHHHLHHHHPIIVGGMQLGGGQAFGMNGVGTTAGIQVGMAPGAVTAGLGTAVGAGLGLGTAGVDHLTLVLNDNLLEREIYYKIRPTTKLGRLMRYHCQMMGQTLAWTRFVVIEKGVHLNQTDTAAEMGIVDGDHIKVIFHSYSIVANAS